MGRWPAIAILVLLHRSELSISMHAAIVASTIVLLILIYTFIYKYKEYILYIILLPTTYKY